MTDIPQSDPVSILLKKQDVETNSDTPQGGANLANAEFTIKYFSVQMDTDPEAQGITPTRTWVVKTDERGFARLGEKYKVSGDDFYHLASGDITLPLGTFTVQETKSPEGYLLNSEIFIRQVSIDGQSDRVSTYNAPIVPEQVMKGSVELYKRDSESGNLLAGAVYGIYFAGNEVGRLTTDQNGYAKSGLLPYGDYVLQEITAPAGHVLDKTQHQFKISANGAVVTVNATNDLQKGKIRILKTDVNSTLPLTGAVFEVYAKTDIVTQDGTVKYTAGQPVDTVTTDENGKFTSKELHLGTYVVREQTAPDGYVLDAAEHEVTLTYGGQNTAIVLSSISLQNERQKVQITLKKEMEPNTAYPNPEAYKDVQFGLFAAEDIAAVDGSIALEKGSLLEVITPDDALTGTTTMDLPIGSYYLQEIATNKAYLPDETQYPVEFTYAGQDIATVEIVANEGKVIYNKLKKGTLLLTKKGTNGTLLSGAEIEILTTDMQPVIVGTTDDNGQFSCELPLGDYLYHEIKAPDGYVLNDAVQPVTITEHGQLIELELLNDPVPPPQTGDSSIAPYMTCAVLASGFIALAIFAIAAKKKKQ